MTRKAVSWTCSGEIAPWASSKRRKKHTALIAVQRLEDYDFSLECADKIEERSAPSFQHLRDPPRRCFKEGDRG